MDRTSKLEELYKKSKHIFDVSVSNNPIRKGASHKYTDKKFDGMQFSDKTKAKSTRKLISVDTTVQFEAEPILAEYVFIDYVNDTGSFSVGFAFGALENVPTVELGEFSVGFATGSLELGVITSSATDYPSAEIAFVSGFLTDNVVTSSAPIDTGTADVSFYTGSLVTQVITGSASGSIPTEQGEMTTTLVNGAIFDEVEVASNILQEGMTVVGFFSGSLT